jgi:hypothetical protein
VTEQNISSLVTATGFAASKNVMVLQDKLDGFAAQLENGWAIGD